MPNRARKGLWSRRALDRPQRDKLRHGITQAFGGVEGAPRELLDLILLMVDQRSSPTDTSDRPRRFAIVDPPFNAAVVRWAFENAKRPRITINLWMEMQKYMLAANNEVQMDREHMMRATGASTAHVSCALAELASVEAVQRIKHGREVRWRITTLAATHLTGAAREKAQKAEPRLLVPLRPEEA